MGRGEKKNWGLEELLSVVGFVFELLRVVVNALRKRGGTIEDLRRLLKDSALVDQVFDLIVVKPVAVITPHLLSLVGSTSEIFFPIPGGKFVVRDHFKVDVSDKAWVKISFIGDNFKNWFLGLVEGRSDAVCFSSFNLLQRSVDGLIIQELGGESKVVVTAWSLWELLKAQNKGQSGILLIDGCANIFYIWDVSGVLRTVSVRWHGGGWDINADWILDSSGWFDRNRIFSRNS